MTKKIDLRSPAGNLQSLIAAVDAGADGVYIGFRSPTNLRNFPGLNFSFEEAKIGIEYGHSKGKEIYGTINVYPELEGVDLCFKEVDSAYSLGVDAVILTDLSVLEYTCNKYPDLEIHLSVQAGNCNAETIQFYQKEFGIKCVILSRVLTVEEIKEIRKKTDVDLEIFVFGSICANYEGRCQISSYITGVSSNSGGACTPLEFVEYIYADNGKLKFKLNEITLNEFDEGEFCTYPTPCKGRYLNTETNKLGYSFQSPVTLNMIEVIPELAATGVDAFKIEGRQRSNAYTEKVTKIFRSALDEYYKRGSVYRAPKEWLDELCVLSEGIT
ncbi:MAG TPA: U32 family peptidase [bacterium]|nr:U32 family peptidase [bacterium]